MGNQTLQSQQNDGGGQMDERKFPVAQSIGSLDV